jgi:hypothetical protein
MTGPGAGLCVADPGDCPVATTVGFTWELSGCHSPSSDASVRADAAIGATDGGDANDAPSATDAVPEASQNDAF